MIQTPHHSADPVTHHARPDFVRVREDQTVEEALAGVRESGSPGRIVYFYVLDEEDCLKGVVPTRRLLLSAPGTKVRDVMIRNVITLPETATVFDACGLFIKHRLLALPVVSPTGKMQGIVDVELYTEGMDDVHRHTEADDIFQLIGVRLAEVQTASVPQAFVRRFPWLLSNVAGGLACAAVSGAFSDLLAQVVALSFFVPVVLALGESVSIQSLTLALQVHLGPGVSLAEVGRRLLRELPLGGLLGGGCGLIVAAAAFVWQGQWIAACLLVSITASVTTAALFGTLTPLLLRWFRFDPKVASGPVTLAAIDIVTLTVYLGTGTLMFL